MHYTDQRPVEVQSGVVFVECRTPKSADDVPNRADAINWLVAASDTGSRPLANAIGGTGRPAAAWTWWLKQCPNSDGPGVGSVSPSSGVVGGQQWRGDGEVGPGVTDRDGKSVVDGGGGNNERQTMCRAGYDDITQQPAITYKAVVDMGDPVEIPTEWGLRSIHIDL